MYLFMTCCGKTFTLFRICYKLWRCRNFKTLNVYFWWCFHPSVHFRMMLTLDGMKYYLSLQVIFIEYLVVICDTRGQRCVHYCSNTNVNLTMEEIFECVFNDFVNSQDVLFVSYDFQNLTKQHSFLRLPSFQIALVSEKKALPDKVR